MVEVGQSVELNRLVSPLALNARAKLGGETSWLADVSADDLLILIHDRDPLAVRQQKSLSGLWQHPKGRITTSNPGLLGCSAPGGVTAENPRSRAHYAHQGEDTRSGDADESAEVAVYHFRILGSSWQWCRHAQDRSGDRRWQDTFRHSSCDGK